MADVPSGRGPDARASNSSPLEQVQAWYELARAEGVPEPEAAALATATAAGRPSVRMVLIRGIDARGVAFYTNRKSRKGRELAENPYGAIAIHWHALQRQIRLEGAVEPLSDEESDAYFATRAHGSQIGAWASDQSAADPRPRDAGAARGRVRHPLPDRRPAPAALGRIPAAPGRRSSSGRGARTGCTSASCTGATATPGGPNGSRPERPLGGRLERVVPGRAGTSGAGRPVVGARRCRRLARSTSNGAGIGRAGRRCRLSGRTGDARERQLRW